MLSKTNVKYIQSLRHKKFREEEQAFVAEGPKVVEEFLSSGNFTCTKLFALEEWLNKNQRLIKKISPENLYPIIESELERISFLQTPNQVLAIFQLPAQSSGSLEGMITLILDDLQDPGNLGTIIRIADWFNIKNIICSHGSVDCYNPKVVQASMGSLARVNVIYTDLETFIKENSSIELYAATLSGKNISGFEKIKQGMILIGNESKGVSESLLRLATGEITIPGSGKADSLNAAVATGIILSHIIA